MDPSQLHNLLALVTLSLAENDVGSAELHLRVFIDEIQYCSTTIGLDSKEYLDYLYRISQIYELGYPGLAIVAWRGLIHRTDPHHRKSIEAWVDSVAGVLSLQGSSTEIGNQIDVLDARVIEIIDLFFRDTNHYGYLIMAQVLSSVSDHIRQNQCSTQNLPYPVTYLMATVNSAFYYLLSSRSLEAQMILTTLSTEALIDDTIDPDNNFLPLSLKKYSTELALFVYCFCLFYLEDDPDVLYPCQLIAAERYSLYVKSSYRDLIDGYFPSLDSKGTSLPPRVGYLSTSFCRHSVGFLSHQIIQNHSRDRVHVYCYQYEKSVPSQDEIYNSIKGSVYCFRDLSSVDLRTIVEIIRQDQLDVLVYMDSLTSILGCQLIALRLAPMQISWLGGDTPGLPEVDYVFVDHNLISDQARSHLGKKLIPLTVFTAVEELTADPVDPKRFRKQIGALDHTVVYWSAAIAHKRSMECIVSHVQILSQVPDSLLVIKGAGDQRSVRDQYEAVATELGVNHRLRFVAMSPRSELHRAQLRAADLILDTFPYTGSTHTVEALSAGVPVLTKVGRHYYGRMSYSLVRSVGLDKICSTYSVADYIECGVQLGLEPALLQEAKQCIQRTKISAPLWDPRALAREMESVYRRLVLSEIDTSSA